LQALVRDGVRLAYEERGAGDPPMLFVHGWMCDRGYFAPQVEHFGARHRTIAVDLRGHGASDKPQQAYPIAGFADDLNWLCAQLGVRGTIVVGHSMGGIVAMDLAARYPERAIAVVGVDAPLVPPASLMQAVPGVIEQLESSGYYDIARGLVSQMFLPTDDGARKASIVDAMSSTPQHVMVGALRGMFTHDAAAAAASCKVPVLLIGSAVPPVDVAQLSELCPQVVIGQTVGSGHFNQLEVPEQVNAMIERFLQVSL
jgi:pimeloyl-ACP methyl ester carboxylesterase